MIEKGEPKCLRIKILLLNNFKNFFKILASAQLRELSTIENSI